MTLVFDDETKKREQHLKRLLELSVKSQESLRDIPELEEPNEEQKQWIKGKRRFV
jgi:hypothetical protein